MAYIIFMTSIGTNQVYALTGGPAQPEFNSFTPIGTSDMVDLSSGDFNYNIPIMDIGGFPINLAYNSGVTMDDEASWVGLGWNLSIGQINRQMRGIPDDFDGDKMTYENDMKDNYTVGATFQFTPGAVGFEFENGILTNPEYNSGNLSYGVTAQYNSYNGFTMSPSLGLAFDMGQNSSVGLNVKSDENGMSISPSVSFNQNINTSKKRGQNFGATIGLSFNSRQGLSALSFSASRSAYSRHGKSGAFKVAENGQNSNATVGSSVSYVDNYYTPTVQDGLTSVNFTFNAGIGSEFFGLEGEGSLTAFGSNQFIPDGQNSQQKSVYGYNNTHEASDNSVKDFNREKDGNFSVNSTNLPLTNYTYDIYSVQGQGVSGMFRPYRSQVGYVNDPLSVNAGGGLSLAGEFSGGGAFHLGTDIEQTVTGSYSGVWSEPSGNNAKEYFAKPPTNANALYEEVYFKNVGDLSVDQESDMYGTNQTELGQYSPIRLKLGGDKFDRTVEPTYEIKHETTPDAFYQSNFN
ncbi:MAG: hypothetical protein JNJ99_02275, partial [Crocinitomicaceae bacterium]|nr:hypothetical protein [Crocinitomicaceae bacterium]